MSAISLNSDQMFTATYTSPLVPCIPDACRKACVCASRLTKRLRYYSISIIQYMSSLKPAETHLTSLHTSSHASSRCFKLVRAGPVQKAGALNVRTGQAIQRQCWPQPRQHDDKTDARCMWAAVRQLTGRQQTKLMPIESPQRH